MDMRRNSISVLTIFIMIALALLLPGLCAAGSLEPTDPPGPTMRTVDEIYSTNSWSKKLSCDSTTNCPRFEILADFNNEAVLDKETGLVWWKNASRYGSIWVGAIYVCKNSELGGRKGWRLPTVEELSSLVDPTKEFPALPSGQPFVDAGSTANTLDYWTATTDFSNADGAWCVGIGVGGEVGMCYKNAGPFNYGVWCVRGGQGYFAY